MSKNIMSIALIATFVLTTGIAMADIQSPIYTDEIGRSHFLGKGGYSGVRQMQMNSAQSDFVNDAVYDYSQKEEKEEISKQVEEEANELKPKEDVDITKVIKDNSEVPVTSKTKMTVKSDKRELDASAPFGYGATTLPATNLNNSKTLYTDELGRLHFFREANQIKK